MTILVLIAALPVAAEGTSISSYDTTVNVSSDNSYTVTQSIVANFQQPGTTITRTIPGLAPSGKKLTVKRISCNTRCRKKKTDGDYVLTLGSRRSGITEAYTLSYTCKTGYDYSEEYDILQVNLADSSLGADVAEFTFTVTMPADFNMGTLRLVSGYYGDLPEDKAVCTKSGNVITGYIDGGLMAFETIDLVIDLPNGYFAEAARSNKTGNFIQTIGPVLALLLCIAGLIMLFGFCKNPAIDFTASADTRGLNPPEMLYIISGDITPEQMTSLIPYWAMQGYLTLEKTKNGTVLTRLRYLSDDFPEYERQLFDYIFSTEDSVLLVHRNNALMGAVQRAIRGLIAKYDRSPIFKKIAVIPLSFAAALPLAACIVSFISCGNAIFGLRLGFFLVVVLFTLLACLTFAATVCVGNLGRRQGLRINLLGPILGFIILAIAVSILYRAGGTFLCSIAAGISLFCAYLLGMELWSVNLRTPYGLELIRSGLAVRDFLRYATDKLLAKASAGSEKGLEGLYYSMLPYAGAFSLEGTWTEKFMNIRMTKPTWLIHKKIKNITPLVFSAMLEECMEPVKRAMTGKEGDRALTMIQLRAAGRRVGGRAMDAGNRLLSGFIKVRDGFRRIFRKNDDTI